MIVFASATLLSAQTQVDRAWSRLEEGCTDQNAAKRGKAVQALALLPNNVRAQRMAEKVLQRDEKSEVKAAAALALGQIGARSSVITLRAALKDEDPEVVLAAADSLYLLRDSTAYEVYYAVLTGERKSGDSLLESHTKKLKDPQFAAKMGIGFIPFGGIGYDLFKAFTNNDTSSVRAAAAQKLVWDPDLRSADALTQATSDDMWLVRAAALAALARRGNPASLKTVIPLLEDKNDTVRYTSAAAVVRLSGRSSLSSASLKKEQP
jgi:HEAT repeat protein